MGELGIRVVILREQIFLSPKPKEVFSLTYIKNRPEFESQSVPN